MIKGESKNTSQTVTDAYTSSTGNLLELFAGSRSVGKVGERLGYNVFSIDWKEYDGINLAIDIGNLKKKMYPLYLMLFGLLLIAQHTVLQLVAHIEQIVLNQKQIMLKSAI